MKTPRLTDFDPTTSVPELGSPMDGLPVIGPSGAQQVPPIPQSEIPTTGSPDLVRPDVRTPVGQQSRTSVRRTITRYAFEFFQDQIENLRKFSLEEKVRGEKGSMSGMVREALDMYIAKRHRTED